MMCVWMSSGIVEYKLCDQNFDCENCPFDKVIRNKLIAKSSGEALKSIDIIDEIVKKIGNENYSNRFIYLKNGMFLKNLFDNKYYIGFSPVMNYLLDNVKIVSKCNRGDEVKLNDKMIELKWEWGSIIVESPFTYTCLGQFDSSDNKPSDHNWFGLIEINREQNELNQFSKDGYELNLTAIILELQKYKGSYSIPNVYCQDGGFPVDSLCMRIGKSNYISFLKKLIAYKS